jgi:hypothetical protein
MLCNDVVGGPTRDRILNALRQIEAAPRLGTQAALQEEAVAFAHYSLGQKLHWYFTELNRNSGVAYGWRTQNDGKTWFKGHCDISTLKELNASLDIYFDGKTIREIKNDRCKL